MMLQGWSPLHLAALIAHPDMVALLLSHGADVMVKSTEGESALQMACQGAVRSIELQSRLPFFEGSHGSLEGCAQNAAAYPTL